MSNQLQSINNVNNNTNCVVLLKNLPTCIIHLKAVGTIRHCDGRSKDVIEK